MRCFCRNVFANSFSTFIALGALSIVVNAHNASGEETKTDQASLFDGKTLGKWKVTDFGGHGKVHVADGNLVIEGGVDLSGVTYSGQVQRDNYEISLEAKRAKGEDFFCGLTFPIGKDHASLIVGGWGGGIVGISSLNSADASENQTTSFHEFKNDQWYSIRVRVTPKKLEAWIGKEQVVDLLREDHRFSVRFEVEPSQPLGIATWQTTAHIRNINLKKLSPAAEKPQP